MRADAAPRTLIEAASAPYRAAGRFALHFARGKLTHDPAFAVILAQGLLAGRGRILDLGCGQGLLAAWLTAARSEHAAGRWPPGWPPPPPAPDSYRGVEINPHEVERARIALGARVQIVADDIRQADYGSPDAIVMLDVLHYVDPASQEAVLTRARTALGARGLLVLRVADADGGVRFRISRCVDRAVALVRRGRLLRLCCRPAREWHSLLVALGFAVRASPMRAAASANVLLVGELP